MSATAVIFAASFAAALTRLTLWIFRAAAAQKRVPVHYRLLVVFPAPIRANLCNQGWQTFVSQNAAHTQYTKDLDVSDRQAFFRDGAKHDLVRDRNCAHRGIATTDYD